MKKTTIALALTILAVTAAAAFADTTATPSLPLTIKLGAAWPTQHGGNTIFTAGADYAFTKAYSDSNTTMIPSVYADYFDVSDHNLGGVGVAIRSYNGEPGVNNAVPYLGLGIGDYFYMHRASNDSAGGKIFAGIELPHNLIGEISYTQKFSGSGNGAFAVEAGYRF